MPRESDLSKCDENIQRPSDLVPLVPQGVSVKKFDENDREFRMYADEPEEHQHAPQDQDVVKHQRYRQR